MYQFDLLYFFNDEADGVLTQSKTFLVSLDENFRQ